MARDEQLRRPMGSMHRLLHSILDFGGRPPPREEVAQAFVEEMEDDDDSEPPYVPSHFDGEYNVWFRARPLGVGLVPSTQLYGVWEVSSVRPPDRKLHDAQWIRRSLGSARGLHRRERGRSHSGGDEDDGGQSRIARGDVVIALNFSCKKARLPRDAFRACLQRSAFPIVMTLRKPDVYGAFDSHAVSTAMYPASIEHKGRATGKKFAARATSKQWQRTLRHDLSVNAQNARHEPARRLAEQLVHGNKTDLENADGARQDQMLGNHSTLSSEGDEALQDDRFQRPDYLSPLGEFVYTFTDHPMRLGLGPSTRFYGSVEVYEPQIHAPVIQVGDVIVAVNGDTAMAQTPSDDLVDQLNALTPPISVRFRRPIAYRRYLMAYFHPERHMSSESTAQAMFPNSAEYKKLRAHESAVVEEDQVPRMASDFQLDVSTRDSLHSPVVYLPGFDAVPRTKLDELREFSVKMNMSDQFKMWAGHRPRAGSSQGSSILTERHVRFLWSHLPTYLTCNEMELAYTTRRHGWNLLSFYSMLDGKGPTILVVKDTEDNIFGAFCSASWKRSNEVYGNGRSFVFTLRPHMQAFVWSGLENSFMYTRRDAVFVGGGKKGIALCLQLDDERGFTQECQTFLSPALSEHGSFRCEVVEAWCFSGFKI